MMKKILDLKRTLYLKRKEKTKCRYASFFFTEKELIGRILVEEMYDILKSKVPFNEKRYAKKLSMLP